MPSLVDVNALSHSFVKNGQPFRALNSVNIHIDVAECVGIVGASGCGKSTLARLLCRINTVGSGEITLDGQPIEQQKLTDYYQQVQMVFQDPFATFPARMKVRQYLLEPFINFKLIEKSQHDALAQELLGRFIYLVIY